MRRIGRQSFEGHAATRILTLLAALLVAAVEASGQERQADRPTAPESPVPIAAPQVERRIVVSIPDRKLALIEDGRVLKVYAIAVGAKASPSPTGEYRIVHRIPRPTYYAPGKVIAPGPANPLGTRWLGLSLQGFGIHGTNEPRSIGRNSSHGCIRMRNRDVEELFDRVRAGDRVELHATRTDELAQIFGVPKLPATKVAEQGKGKSTPAAAAIVAVTLP